MALPVFSDGMNWRGFLAINVGCKRPYDRCCGVPCKFFSNAFMCCISVALKIEICDVVHLAGCTPCYFPGGSVEQARFKIGADYRLVSIFMLTIKRIEVDVHCGIGRERLDFASKLRESV